MNNILVREFPPLRQAFKLQHVPFLGRYYRWAYHAPPIPGLKALWQRIARKLFPLYRRVCGASTGVVEYTRLQQTSRIEFNARNVHFFPLYELHSKNGYEPEVAALLDVLLPAGGTFYDIGTNWGYFSMYVASGHQQAKIFSFEPTPETYRDFTSCLRQAGLDGAVTAHNIALSNVDGEAFMQIPDGLHSVCAEVSQASGSASIKTRRLDSLNLPLPDFIKMDVENHELEVLEGAERTMQTARPFLVFESKLNYLEPGKNVAVLLRLRKMGYKLFVPGVKYELPAGSYFIQPWWHHASTKDGLGLVPFEPETRLLWQHEINVFACHESRLPELLKIFKPWP